MNESVLNGQSCWDRLTNPRMQTGGRAGANRSVQVAVTTSKYFYFLRIIDVVNFGYDYNFSLMKLVALKRAVLVVGQMVAG